MSVGTTGVAAAGVAASDWARALNRGANPTAARATPERTNWRRFGIPLFLHKRGATISRLSR
jgi:hypothetical protein